jgi:RNase H-fold protein (predicted Holliday junction resolvase)
MLGVKNTKKRGIVDTISAVYILEVYINKKWFLQIYWIKIQ